MTKKHFIALADAIRRSPVTFTDAQLSVIADFCRTQNYAFDRYRWMRYTRGLCGPSGGEIKGK